MYIIERLFSSVNAPVKSISSTYILLKPLLGIVVEIKPFSRAYALNLLPFCAQNVENLYAIILVYY